ncbi:MAG: hypothetical protein HN402_07755 [Candidatus Scalindua sp.]|jgi:hypothetical protein|nr:hypothetical protein [Candidatus Scalindua sp.]MBT6757351.1 hypothetical protein [Candidatus Jacksonbacteria bacterium]
MKKFIKELKKNKHLVPFVCALGERRGDSDIYDIQVWTSDNLDYTEGRIVHELTERITESLIKRRGGEGGEIKN